MKIIRNLDLTIITRMMYHIKLLLPDYRQSVARVTLSRFLLQPEDRQKATQAWAKIQHSMTSLGVSSDEMRAVCHVLGAIYHLGVAGAATGTSTTRRFGTSTI